MRCGFSASGAISAVWFSTLSLLTENFGELAAVCPSHTVARKHCFFDPMSLETSVQHLVNFYSEFSLESVDRLGEVYDRDVVFQDPINVLHGLASLQDYFREMMQGVKSCRFEILSTEILTTQAAIEWRMFYAHPRLNHGLEIVVEGVSLVTGDDRIKRHRDYFDLGSMLYEHVPVIGYAVKRLKRRLQS